MFEINDNSRDDIICPICEAIGMDCDHYAGFLDLNERFVDGLLVELFTDPITGDISYNEELWTRVFPQIENVFKTVKIHSDGGPGMSTIELWCWSKDPVRSIAEIQQKLEI
jgi:hypothetical protein